MNHEKKTNEKYVVWHLGAGADNLATVSTFMNDHFFEPRSGDKAKLNTGITIVT